MCTFACLQALCFRGRILNLLKAYEGEWCRNMEFQDISATSDIWLSQKRVKLRILEKNKCKVSSHLLFCCVKLILFHNMWRGIVYCLINAIIV